MPGAASARIEVPGDRRRSERLGVDRGRKCATRPEKVEGSTMSKPDHVSDDQLVRMIDDELTRPESTLVESHLGHCDECSRRHRELRSLSVRIEAGIGANVSWDSGAERESLRQALEARERKIASARPRKVLQKFGWGMAVAAMLSLGILFGPQWTHRTKSPNAVAEHGQTNATFDVD